MVLRVLEYLVRAWTELLRQEPKPERLPPVACVIVHHGERGWSEPTSLHDLVDGVKEVPVLARFTPNLEILVDDLITKPDEELKQRHLGGFPSLVLWALRDARQLERFLSHLRVWAAELSRLVRESPEDAVALLRYIFQVLGETSFEEVQQKIIEVAPETESAMATVGEQLIQRGRAQGKGEGKAEGKAEAILSVLEARALKVSAEQRARITASKDVAELDRWLRLAATATDADALFSH